MTLKFNYFKEIIFLVFKSNSEYKLEVCQIWTCDDLRGVVCVKRWVGSRWAPRPKKERSKSESFLNGKLLIILHTHTLAI